jgi:alpha-galactosidase
LHGLSSSAIYTDAEGETYSGAHLLHVGLPVEWSETHDAEVVVLYRS